MSTRIRSVVVGAGAAGAPLAARLSEDPAREVVLLEAGHAAETPADLLDGGALRGALPDHSANWAYQAELVPGLPHVVARGRILGGSTAINGGYFVRATPDDFARWAESGGPAWSYERALPVLRALENDLDYGESFVHGARGPMLVSRPPQSSPAAAAFHAAAREHGFPEEVDKNAAGMPGIGPVPSNIIDGVRINTGIAYLDAVDSQVDIRGNTRALRVVLENDRVVGVETSSGYVKADEVVLAAGAIATPQLLMLSGIGPRVQLEELGIGVTADLPVGAAFSDHPNLALEWRTSRPIVDWQARYAFPTALNFDAAGCDRSLPSRPEGDLEILLAAKPLDFLLSGRRPDEERLQFLVALQDHVGRGRLSLHSADPLEAPRIEYHYLARKEDRARMRVGVRTGVRLLSSRAFADTFGGLTELDDVVLDSNARLDEWILAHLGTAMHMCGTAPMGPVVDGAGRVHGITGLRVADTSLLPTAPHRGPAATAVFIGELIARQMRAETHSASTSCPAPQIL